ncbi:ion transporter [Mycobacterium eburneum]|nr:potassium channel family protein [Mycobacterium eburneum]TDH55885.1 ion transporter [Mycobacterium eburneum]
MKDQAILDRWERRAEWPLAAVALMFLASYSIHVLAQSDRTAAHISHLLGVASWIVFTIDYAVRLWLAPNRRHWFVRHLLDLAVVALPLLRPLRLVRLVILFSALQRAVGNAIRGRVLVYTVSGAVLLVYVASLAELQAERHDPNTTIDSFGNALWCSITTVTTVGYGDVYPVTVAGRIIAALLMIGGMSLVGVITATIASWIVQRVNEAGSTARELTAADIAQLRGEIRALREQLNSGG